MLNKTVFILNRYEWQHSSITSAMTQALMLQSSQVCYWWMDCVLIDRTSNPLKKPC